MIDRQGKIGVYCFADWLAVVPGLGQRQDVEVVFHALRDLVHEDGAMGGAGVTPALAGGVRSIEGPFNVLCVGSRNLAECSCR